MGQALHQTGHIICRGWELQINSVELCQKLFAQTLPCGDLFQLLLHGVGIAKGRYIQCAGIAHFIQLFQTELIAGKLALILVHRFAHFGPKVLTTVEGFDSGHHAVHKRAHIDRKFCSILFHNASCLFLVQYTIDPVPCAR